MVEEKEEELPPEVKKDLIKEGWTPPEGAPETMGAGEGQTPNEASEAPQQASDKQIKQEDKEYTEEETKQDLAKIPTETPTKAPAEQKKFVCDICGKGFDTKRALTGHMQVHSRKHKPEEEIKEKVEKKPLVPYAEMGEPEDFLRGFLEGYEFKDKFIDLLCRRVVLREELPHPNDLAADLLSMEGSGVKSARNASAIAEDYAYAYKKYVGEMREQNRPHTIGYDTRPSESPRYPGGIPYDSNRYTYKDHERPRGRGISVREPQRDREEEERRPDRYDMDQPVTMKDLLLWQREQELQRLREDDGGRRRGNEEEPSWIRDRVEKLEDEIRRRDEERMQRLEDELKAARNTPPPAGVSRDEVANMVEGIFDAHSKKLTAEDVQRIIRDQTADFRVGLTKDDLEYLKAKDQFRLDERKLDEKGKTRDELAKIARGGFSQIGQIVARTLTETGATTGVPTKGVADQTGNILQVSCPGCGAAITAPIIENMIQCPQCGRSYTVERPPYETLPPAPIPPKEEAPIEAGFTVEPPPEQPPKPVEKPVETPELPEVPLSTGVHQFPEPQEPEIEEPGEPIPAERMEEIMEMQRKELETPPVEKKPMPPITGKECPICGKKLKNRRGVKLHITEVHPEYE